METRWVVGLDEIEALRIRCSRCGFEALYRLPLTDTPPLPLMCPQGCGARWRTTADKVNRLAGLMVDLATTTDMALLLEFAEEELEDEDST